VASVLIQLSRRRIINYIPHKVTPVIFYTRDRVPERYLDISREVYEVRKQKFTELIESIIHYATNTTQCRSRMLLSYFGEDNAKDCGVCDVCLARKKNGNIPQGTEDKILTLLSENGSMTIDAITEALKISRDDVVKAVRHLLDNNVILSEAKNLTIKRKNSIEL
ncbi:MAG: RecQ family zinc-binding domain-containing protein, partial [Paludibacteraceae bacterium]|nr:RecQ family zinc-binding domain-containing protein [Paludibacteraceae bacterium]